MDVATPGLAAQARAAIPPSCYFDELPSAVLVWAG
jgi:hypothetical protein